MKARRHGLVKASRGRRPRFASRQPKKLAISPLSRSFRFKQDFQRLVDRLGIEIRVARDPPYTYKYDPIKHRLFPHLLIS